MKRYSCIVLLLAAAIAMYAQSISVHAPGHVSVGEQFQIEYEINTQDVRGIHPGHMPDGIKILYGPSMSSQSSFQIINGHMSSSSTVTYSYIAIATKKGSFTIPAVHVNVGGKQIASSAVRLTASGGSRASMGSSYQQDDDDDYNSYRRTSQTHVRNGEDLFIRVSASKRHVHEQEPILLTYKVYTLVDLTNLDGKMPDLKGFHTQAVKLPQQKTYHRETLNGRTYNCVVWSQYVMYPQMTGKLEIPPITFHGIVMQESRDPLAFYMNGGYEEVRRSIKADGLTIQVDPLPSRPAGFSGGVGKFNISAQLNKDEVKAGDPVTLRLVVSGTGNLKLIKQPEVVFPEGWDKYDAKVTDKTRLTSNGVEGNMVYDILAVPRTEGSYTIPPVKFTYYDTGANAYKTIQTQPFKVNVAKGSGEQTEVNAYTAPVSDDIRPLKQGKVKPHAIDEFFFGSMWYWIWIVLLVAAFVAILFMFRKTAVERADIAKKRGKNANKVATKRLKQADRLMQQQHSDDFYDEVLRALWGYVSDKLNIPLETLSRENISERLAAHQVDDTTISLFISALDECEFERYAPGDAKGNMSKTFDAAMKAITEIEESMKREKKGSSVNQVGMLLLSALLLVPVASHAITKENADTEYKKGNYQQAVKDYEELLKGGVSAELYYNLGNAYYKQDNITQAVLAYERALLLSPGDEDIRFNLQVARSKTIDKITPVSEMFFVTWYKALVNVMSVDAWAYVAIFSLVVLIILLLTYLIAERIFLRKIGFYGGIFFLLLFVFANVFAWQQREQLRNRRGAIVMVPSVAVKRTPAPTAQDNFMLHEGTRVEIIDKSVKNWYQVHLADGREGWIAASNVEQI